MNPFDKLNDCDKKWINSLRLYLGDGNGVVPFFTLQDGSINAVKTMENFSILLGFNKK